MGRMSFSQELRSLSDSSQEVNAGECFDEVARLHRELGRVENALGRAGWTLRYGERGEWRAVLRDAAAETLREARRAASRYDADRLRAAARSCIQLAGARFGDVAGVMLKPGERAESSGRPRRSMERFERVGSDVRFVAEPHGRDGRRRDRERSARTSRRRRRGIPAVA